MRRTSGCELQQDGCSKLALCLKKKRKKKKTQIKALIGISQQTTFTVNTTKNKKYADIKASGVKEETDSQDQNLSLCQ